MNEHGLVLCGAANTIYFSKEIQGSFPSPTDNDFYKVNLAKSENITVSLRTTVRNETYGVVRVFVYNSNEDLISSIISHGPVKIDNTFVANASQLFIKVSRAFSGVDDSLNYFLTVDAHSPI